MAVLIVFLSFIPIVSAPIWYGSGDDSGLVGHWRCENNFLDASGQGNHGTQSGGVTITRGVKGRGCGFDGIDSDINPTNVVNNGLNFTVSAWINIQSAKKGTIVQMWNSNYIETVLRVNADRTITWLIDTNTGAGDGDNDVSINSNALSLNTWYYVTGIRNNTNMMLFIDTSLINSTTLDGNVSTLGTNVRIGGAAGLTNGDYFNGTIDEARIYNRTLSAEEISALYDTGKSYHLEFKSYPALGINDETPAPTISDETGLVGYWKMDDLTNGNATDSHSTDSSQNNGSVIGATFTNNGRFSKGYSFDGDDWILAAGIPSVEWNGTFTFSAWIYPQARGDTNPGVIFQESTSNERNGMTISNTGDVRFGYYTVGTGWISKSGTTALNAWHHVVGVNNATTLLLYIDGVAQTGTTALYVHNAPGLYIGRETYDLTNNFNGTIDEVRIYNRSLSASEVQELYLSKGLVGHWKMDASTRNSTDTYDSSGYYNHGKITGAVLTNEGRFKEGMKFDGVNDYINLPATTLSNDTFTLSAWVKTPTPANYQEILYGDAGGLTSERFGFRIQNGKFRFWNDYNADILSNTNVNTNTWQLFTATYDFPNQEIRLYVNGVYDNAIDTSFLQTSSVLSSNFAIGVRYGAGGYWNGSIDEVRIYNRALSASEIAGLYNGTKSNHIEFKTIPALGIRNETPAPTKSDETGLVGYWKLDGDATDSSGEGNDGTVNGAISTDAGRWNGAYEFETVNTSTLTLDYTTWKDGQTGSVGVFSRNGDDTENYRVIDSDPWNRQTVVWKAVPEGVSGADGGWNSGTFAINNNKTYRFTTWINRKVQGASGYFYLGTHGYGSVNNVSNLAGTATYSNPYFITGGATALPADTWILLVAFVHPYNYSGSNHADSGWYYANGTKYSSSMTDFKWLPQSTSSNHRSYLYYCTDTSVVQQWIYPRVDVIDGTEPSVAELIDGYGSYGDDIVAEVTEDKVSFSFWYDNNSNDSWVHVVNSSGTLYVNGELGTPNEYPIYVYGTNVTIGRTTASNYFNGALDEIRIYNRSLSTDEVKELYLSKGLVGHWKMDASTKNSTSTFDSSGYNNHGLISGAVQTNEGRFKEGYKFDGVNDYLNASDSVSLDITNLTVSTWIKPTSAITNYMYATKGDSTVHGVYLGSGFTDGEWQCGDYNAANTPSGGTINVNEWQMVTCTQQANVRALYVNGALITSAAGSSPTWNNSLNFYIGMGKAVGSYNANGTIDEVRIYNRALTASEVAGLYNGTRSEHLTWWSVAG